MTKGISEKQRRGRMAALTINCQCRFSDAWRCAKDRNSRAVACGCECHKRKVSTGKGSV